MRHEAGLAAFDTRSDQQNPIWVMYFIFSIPPSDLLSSEIKKERNELNVLVYLKAVKCQFKYN